MKTIRLKKIIVRTVLNVLFIIGLLYFFRNNSILRPIAKGAYYKEYLSALFLLSMIYANYLFFIPKLFQKRHYFLYFILAIGGILISSSVEILLVSSNIKSCFPASFDDTQMKLYYINVFQLINLRNTGFLLFFFVLRIFEHEREILKKERIALAKNKGIICVPNGNENIKTISISDISYILHEKNYTYIHTIDGNRYCKYCSLSSMEELLPENLFIRVNRNAIIPLNKINHFTEDSVTILYGNPAQEISFTLSEKYVPNIREKIASAGGLNLLADGLNVQNDGLNGRSGGLNEGINKANLEEFMDNIAHNEDLLILCQIIAKDPSVTMKSLSDQLGVSLKTVERRIKILKDKGILQHSGAKKNGEYVFAPSISVDVLNCLTSDEPVDGDSVVTM
ncbi:MAG: LytTR family transcriptional regulator DNA-binding domain-containing protein [Bacteroidales bacterium]|nr:LytTR family transcriptional regulator DNA-binding domain-containing protein [Bacteroidales bacterium]